VVCGCGPNAPQGSLDRRDEGAGLQHHRVRRQRGSDWDSTVAAFEKVTRKVGPIDILVNNAGITRDGVFRKMSKADWDAVINTNLNSLFNVTKQVIEGMVERNWGRIISISSVNGQKGPVRADELLHGQGRHPRLHDGACPGSGQQGRHREHRVAGLHRHRHGEGHPPRRPREDRRDDPGQAPRRRPTRSAPSSAWLASDDAGFATGADFSLNGGLHMG
jgi:acetoacetyl-CoA reductase